MSLDFSTGPNDPLYDDFGRHLANMSFSAALAHPTFIQDFEAATGATPLPRWICELYAYITKAKKPESRLRQRPKSKDRSVDAANWIKHTNSSQSKGGVRKRKSEIASPRVRKSKYAMPRPINAVQYQRHAIQLMSSVLNTRANASPFTLVLDDLNQRAIPFLQQLVVRALSRNINVVVVSFEGTRFHPAVRNVSAWGNRTAATILADIEKALSDRKESLVIVDSMYDALATKNIDTAALFNLVVMKYASNLVGVYHGDVLPEPSASGADAYAPPPLELLKFMATSIITCRSLAHVLAAKAARERSLAEPTFGMQTGAEGIVQCLHANDQRGIVLEAEFRRKSGRPESETYFLRPVRGSDFHQPIGPQQHYGTLKQELVVLLEQHPAFANKNVVGMVAAADNEMETSFNLGLTDKQKTAREGVVLPYFDAQKQEGGEGGRILYDMGEEDDFDEEEDEI
ncbi:histone acetylation protein 2 [Paraphaeosphaeria minitans]|uniref:Elongator complex protein 5 n=1 Tax=Paraphaeosphaeria minitans TaxID=565426 RepID=A0A9P6GAA4_9PLEO|nr:histone acetylation protein 2 [Paraphaeosphaeria minitans]